MKGRDIPLKLVWREPLGALCGGALFIITFPLRDGTPFGLLMLYPPYFVGFLLIMLVYVAPFALVVGLATGQTVWWLHLRTRKKVEAAFRVLIGVAYASAATLGILTLAYGVGVWLALWCGFLVGGLAGMFSTGQDATESPGRRW